jgi:hypothetical protein
MGTLGAAIGFPIGGPVGAALGGALLGYLGSKGLGYLVHLTPAARSTEVLNNGALILQEVLYNWARTPDEAIKFIQGMRDTPIDMAKQLSMQALEAPDAAALPMALKDFDAGDNMLAAWHATDNQRALLRAIAESTGQTQEQILKALGDSKSAEATLRQFVDIARTRTDDAAKEIARAYDAKELTAAKVQELTKSFIADKLPHTEDLFRAELFDALGSHMSKWAANWFGVKPESAFIRLGGAVKAAQNLVLLGLNPTYFLNNALTNTSTMAAEGILGFHGARYINDYWGRIGYTPRRTWAGLGPTASGQEIPFDAIREAMTQKDWIDTLTRKATRLSEKLSLVSKGASRFESWSSANAMTVAHQQIMGRLKRIGVGINPMPPELAQALGPDLTRLVYAEIEKGLSQREVEQALLSGSQVLPMEAHYDDAARAASIDPDIFRQDLGALENEALDTLRTRLAGNPDNAQIRAAFDDYYRTMQGKFDEISRRELIDTAQAAAAKTGGEGVQGALELYDDIELDEATRWVDNFRDWERVFAETADMEPAQRGAVIRQQREIETGEWDRFWSHKEASYLGISDALGLDNAISRQFTGRLASNMDNWKNFHRERWEKLDRFFNSIYDTRDARQASWDTLQVELDQLYADHAAIEARLSGEMDNLFVQLVETQFPNAGGAARAWRTGVRDIRDQMVLDMRAHRAEMQGLPLEEQRARWTQFLNENYKPAIVERYRQNVEGARLVYDVATGRSPIPGEPGIGKPPEPPGEPPPEVPTEPAPLPPTPPAAPPVAPAIRPTEEAIQIANEIRRMASQVEHPIGTDKGDQHLLAAINKYNAEGMKFARLEDVPVEVARDSLDRREVIKAGTDVGLDEELASELTAAAEVEGTLAGLEEAIPAGPPFVPLEDIPYHVEDWRARVDNPDLLPAGDVRLMFRDAAVRMFNTTDEEAEAVLALMDARAKAWADANGRSTVEWWNSHFAGATVGGMEGVEGALYQQPGAAPVWYSHLERTVEGIQQPKMTVEQLRGMIAKGGVKADELKWTGFDDWLKGKQSVTKQEALDFLQGNRVEVQEVLRRWAWNDEEAQRVTALEVGEMRGFLDANERAELAALRAKPKYAQYTLPGGENYRELLLTLPETFGRTKQPEPITKLPEGYEIGIDSHQPPEQQFHILPPGQIHARPFAGRHPTEEAAINAAIEQLNFERTREWETAPTAYQSSHWQEPNVLAHVRFNDRVDAEGKKVLFIEEVQSDWHQAGRERGYQLTPQENKRLAYLLANDEKLGPEEFAERSALMDRQVTGFVPPQAPFAKTWPELTMKRMLRWAAENGYDRVAWTTGAQQADRYDLAKQVDYISSYRNPDGTYNIAAIKGGSDLLGESGRNVSPRQMADTIGKELADKIVASTETANEWRGADLKVGGAGMRAFYDDMLPSAMNKYGKKWGARVGETTLIMPEYGKAVSLAEAQAIAHVPERLSVHSLDITPAMRQSVLEGQPLFQGPKGAISFLDDGRAILHAMESPDVSTMAHEVGHIFRRDLEGDDLRIAEEWAGVKDGNWKTKHEEKFARGFERYLADGIAPTEGLRAIFEKFKTWLTKIYRGILGSEIDVEISPEMRGVFDRLLGAEPRPSLRPYEGLNPGTPEWMQVWRMHPELQDEMLLYQRLQAPSSPALFQDAPEPVRLPLGEIDAMNPNPPVRKMLEDGFRQNVWPVMENIRSRMTGPGGRVAAGLRDAQLDPNAMKALQVYLTKVWGQMSDVNLASIRWAEHKRDASLLNYSRRIGFDNVLNTMLPYSFWYTRYGLGWALRALERPAWLANYARLRHMQDSVTAQPGFPSRLRRKMRVATPFLPSFMGDIYFDPLHQLFAFEQIAQPYDRYVNTIEQEDRRIVYELQSMLQDGQISETEYRQAATTKSGPIWERALAQFKLENEGELSNPLDFITLLTGPSLPLSIAGNYLKGTPEKINQLPITRMVQAATSLFTPGGVNIEAPFRRMAGLPERGELGNFYIDRELSNMAGEDPEMVDELNRAMVERSGPLYQEAVRRVGLQQAVRTLGAALWLDFFPEGEEEQRDNQLAFSAAVDSQDPEAVAKFFEDHPEYQARLLMGKWNDPEQRMRNFLISQVWQGYRGLPELHQKQVTEYLGEPFQEAFLNKATRSYDAIDTGTLATWANAVKGYVPKEAGATSPGLPSNLADARSDRQARQVSAYAPGLEMAGPEATQSYQDYTTQRENLFGSEIFDVQSQFYNMPEGEVRDQWLGEHPELELYWGWRDRYLADHPEIIPYATSEESQVSGASPEIQQLYYEYRAQRSELFGAEIFDLQDQYFDLPQRSARRKRFLKKHPELTDYWDWQRSVLANFPQLIPYVKSMESIAQAVLGKDYQAKYGVPANWDEFDPALIRQLMGYTLVGEDLGAGAIRELYRIWEKRGREGDDFDKWLEGVAASIR